MNLYEEDDLLDKLYTESADEIENAEPLNDEELRAALVELATVRAALDELSNAEKKLTAQKGALEQRIAETYVRNELLTQKTQFGTFRLVTKLRPTVQNRDAFISWLDQEGYGELAPRTVNASTLTKFVTDRAALEQPPVPKELVSIYTQRSIRFTKPRKA